MEFRAFRAGKVGVAGNFRGTETETEIETKSSLSPQVSVEVGAAQIEPALPAHHLAAVSAQLCRAVGTDRGRIFLLIGCSISANEARRQTAGRATRSGCSRRTRQTARRIWNRTHLRC